MKDEKHENQSKKTDQEAFGPLIRSMNDFFTQQPVRRLLDTMDEFFDRPFPFSFSSIPIDMYETETELIIAADLPGVKKEQIDIEYAEKHLTISIKNVETLEEANEKKHYYVKKHSYNKSSRTIALPYPIQSKNSRATYKDGVLTIHIPKQRRKKLPIDE
ncbi:Hsp20/alpha crystallin family protein [Fredinandcohnia humi]